MRLSEADASSMQTSSWLAQKLAPNLRNNIAGWWEIDGPITLPGLAAAFRSALNDSRDVLVTFAEGDSGLRQVPRDLTGWQPTVHDVRGAADPAEAAH
ncbi:MAG: Linear gramicidin synthase subunit, partial [Mycobacterium sp.]|nr:Linear gramicidin synthase subunit [Mycobacterium sp.]